MGSAARISHTSALILQTIHAGYLYGFNIMETTGLPSGTIYPALRRLEKDALVRGNWEAKEGSGVDRPRRRYYRLTRNGMLPGLIAPAQAYMAAISQLSDSFCR